MLKIEDFDPIKEHHYYLMPSIEKFYLLVSLVNALSVPDEKKDILKQENIVWLRNYLGESSSELSDLLKLVDDAHPKEFGEISPIYHYNLMCRYLKEYNLQLKYAEMGLEVTTIYKEVPLVNSVKLPFTAEEWVDLFNTDGEFLHQCCALISEIRDTLISTLRSGGFISASNLQKLVFQLEGHSGECYSPEKDDDPINRLLGVWLKIKGEVYIDVSFTLVDLENPNDVFEKIHRASANTSFNRFFRKKSFSDSPTDTLIKSDERHKLLEKLDFAKIYPAIKTLYDHIVLGKDDPQECFVIYETTEQSHVMLYDQGLAVFTKLNEANKILRLLQKEQEENVKSNRERLDLDLPPFPVRKFVVLKAVVSIAKGIEFVEE